MRLTSKKNTKPAKAAGEQLPRYLGLCGAIVTIRPVTRPTEHGPMRGYEWFCECGESGENTELSPAQMTALLRTTRRHANEHARTCRALPPAATE